MLIALLALSVALAAQEPAADPPSDPPTPVVIKPRWLRTPSADLVRQVYPKAARRKRIGGRVIMSCEVGAKGLLTSCRVISESPAGYGFGEAALQTAGGFQMTETILDGESTAGATVRIPLSFHP